MEKMAPFTLSVVGRISSDLGDASVRPFAAPAITRKCCA